MHRSETPQLGSPILTTRPLPFTAAYTEYTSKGGTTPKSSKPPTLPTLGPAGMTLHGTLLIPTGDVGAGVFIILTHPLHCVAPLPTERVSAVRFVQYLK
jgi:hypothetical protein